MSAWAKLRPKMSDAMLTPDQVECPDEMTLQYPEMVRTPRCQRARYMLYLSSSSRVHLSLLTCAVIDAIYALSAQRSDFRSRSSRKLGVESSTARLQ